MAEQVDERRGEQGFTLIELLVVIIILGILSAVVVFAVRGSGDKGQEAAELTDAKTVRSAQEAFCAKFGSYGTERQLAGLDPAPDGQTHKFLSEESTITDVGLTSGGPCRGGGIESKSGFVLGYAQPNGPGASDKIETLTMTASGAAAGGGNGWPTPFQWVRGPGHLNANYIFDPLLWKDSTGEYIPWLATKVPTPGDGISPDFKTYTFTLRENVKWHDGQGFDADDVKFSFDYRKTGAAATATPPDPCFCKSVFSFIDSVTVNSPTSVSFNLNTAIPNTFLSGIGTGMIIIPQHIWSTIATPTTGQQNNPSAYIGTGAYKMRPNTTDPVNYDPATGENTYVGNTSFFLGTPYVRNLRFVAVGTDPIAALATKAVDAAGPGTEESVSDAALGPVVDLPRVQNPGGWTRAFHFNLTKGFPYSDVKFRQAVAYTIDRKELVQSIIAGRGLPGSMGGLAPSHPMLAPGLPAYDRDVAKAKALLDQLGIVDTDADGKRECPVANPCQVVNNDNSVTQSVTPANFTPNLYTANRFSNTPVTAVQQYLADIGIGSTMVVEGGGPSDTRATQGNYGIMMVGWGNVTSDSDQLRTRLLGSYTASRRSFSSIYGWNNPTFDTLANQQLFEPNPAVRKQQVQQMQQLVAAEVPQIQLYVPDALIIHQRGTLSAWYSTPGGTPPGPPGFNNKHVFITGKQFGLPAGF